MFEVAFSEVIIVVVVACYVLDVKDIPTITRAIRKAFKCVNDYFLEIKKLVFDLENQTGKIIDLEGNEQITYNIDDIMPDIKNKRKKKNEQ